ncbi:ATP-dependent helicase [Pseudomonas putida]|uniref:ATP-dependent helicase n=1 Tax=Pseudomonas putida TaxID=303 RepID=UPI0018A942D2|nr:ATP-dependent helicase [Pseudomonas putida]MBF8668360.1 ATP-dependent helicase [Pseudomonas putida]MBF8710821.1 ATP-dependent helicase [Pseudomonas putida]
MGLQHKVATDPLNHFTPATRTWFGSIFHSPTAVQVAAWAAIGAGENALVIAPTGSGKTLAAFMQAIDQLFKEREMQAASTSCRSASSTRILYISPIKALGADVQRNLRIPLHGITAQRKCRGDVAVEITVGMRTGDTPPAERARLLRRPPDILITTPESLYLMLTSKARENLRHVRTVIVDEVHAVAGGKRGSHLALSLERLDALLPEPAQRVGLSATVRPIEGVARFLGGSRPVTVVNPPTRRQFDLRIVVPVEDMTDIPARTKSADGLGFSDREGSIWPHIEASILDQVLLRRSTIVFANSRGLAEKLTSRLNELYSKRLTEEGNKVEAVSREVVIHKPSSAGGTSSQTSGALPLIARSHHGSVSKEQRSEIEQALKTGELRCVVATSSLELGIDMGLVELVIQVAAPPSVASALQRVGRAGHHVGGTSAGLIYPRTRRDLIDAAVIIDSMLAGRIEAIEPPSNPLDVLAQQTVAAVAMETLNIEQWYAMVRRAAPFHSLPRSAFDAVIDMLAGRYPSEDFAEFRPRLVWHRESGLLSIRPGAKQLAVISGGTIPDRGTFSVVLPEGEEQSGSRRVGELDEEMVYESRVNDIVTLGTSSWRIQQITHDQVVVTPAPGRSARLPFWRGDGLGRPAELGEAIGTFLARLEGVAGQDGNLGGSSMLKARLDEIGLDRNAVSNLIKLASEQLEATGTLPTNRTLVLERCRDESEDWRVILHSPFGRRVHDPWALMIAERIRKRWNIDPSVVASDDGIIVRIPNIAGRVPGAELFLFDPQTLRKNVTDAVSGSALFAARFRECAARALLLPRRMPGRRSPLWQQRLRAGQLLAITQNLPDFPILIETARECLQDVYDLSALGALMKRLEDGATQIVEVTTEVPSPFAASMLFGYVAEFMYEADAPLAERRTSVLSLDSGLLSDLLGQVNIGELLDPEVIDTVYNELQRLAPSHKARGLEGVADLLRQLGPLSTESVARRLIDGAYARTFLADLERDGRAIRVLIGDSERWAAIEDAAHLRDALGIILPAGLPNVFLEATQAPLSSLLSRYARTHPPFSTVEAAHEFGLGVTEADEVLKQLSDQGTLLRGNFGVNRRLNPRVRNDDIHPLARCEWLSDEVFKRLRKRSLQAAREATRPVPHQVYARLLLECHGVVPVDTGNAAICGRHAVGGVLSGVDGVTRVIEQLAGVALPVSLWESQILPARVRDYVPGLLDELIAAGTVLWSGRGRLGETDGLVALHLHEFAAETLRRPADLSPAACMPPLQQQILASLANGGAYFVRQLMVLVASGRDSVEPLYTPSDIHAALWELAWGGYVTADTWSPLRAYCGASSMGRARPVNVSPRRRGRFIERTHAFEVSVAVGPALGDPTLAGRWSLLHYESENGTAQALAQVEGLLDRYGVVTRSAAMSEDIVGGFPALRPVFRGMEDVGRVLRGRFVDGLGAAQFAERITVDRLRELASRLQSEPVAVSLSAVDPANPYGTLLPWPPHSSKLRPARRVGALVVLVDGHLMFYLAQGGRHLLSYGDSDADNMARQLAGGLTALAAALKRGKSTNFTLERVDDQSVYKSPLCAALRAIGFTSAAKGLTWYGC